MSARASPPILSLLGVPGLISFAGGFPDPSTFPRERAAALLAEFAASSETSAFQYAPTRGLAGPLDAVAARLEATQGRRPADDELLIASGAIEALELVSKTFLDAGDLVVIEAPTYLGAIMAFRGYDAELVAVPMDEHGLQVDELERRLADGVRPKLLYTIPDHQNPAGVSMSTERRELLVELARRHGFLIVEDVAYRELAFEGDALPSLWSLAPDVGRAARDDVEDVLPRRAARLGRRAVGDLRAARQREAEHRPVRRRARAAALRGVRPPRLDRGAARAVARALPAQVGAHARRARAVDAERHDVDDVRTAGSSRGSRFPTASTRRPRAARGREGVGIVPGGLFYADGSGADKVRLSFSMVDEQQIDEGIELLASLVRSRPTTYPVRTTTSLSAPDSAPHTSPGRPRSWRTAAPAVGSRTTLNRDVRGSKRTIAFAPKSVSHTTSRLST